MDIFTLAYVAISLLIAGIAAVALFFIGFVLALQISYLKAMVKKDERHPVVGTVFSQLIQFNTLFDYLTSPAHKYPTYRLIAFPHDRIYTCDPANIEYILKTNFSNYSKGEYIYNIMKDLFGDGIFTVDGDKWRHQRKLASHEFSTRVLREFSSCVFRDNAVKLAEKASDAATANMAMDMQDLLMKTTLDSIFKVGFGVDLNGLSGSDEFGNQFNKAFDEANVISYWRFVDVFWKLKRFLNIGTEAAMKKHVKVMDNFVFRLICRKREQMKNEKNDRSKEDILSRFLVESKKDPDNMTDQYLRDIILNFIIAGRDTTSATLTWFFYMLCKHPLIQEKVAREVREASEANEDASISEFAASLTEDAIDKMHYLHATLSETLRLYPAVPVDAKNTDEDDEFPDGFRVKKGDMVNYMPYAMGRMTYIWGEDAEDFKPERWLENGVFRPESSFKFTAFQAGPRICLGKEFAYRQMKILAAVLLRFFKYKLMDENKEATYTTRFTLHMDHGLHLFAFHRLLDWKCATDLVLMMYGPDHRLLTK